MGSSAKGKSWLNRIIVCDTGPLIHLTEAGSIDLIKMAGSVFIPQIVADEFANNSISTILSDWLMVTTLDVENQKVVKKWVNEIEPGEAYSIALAIQIKADWLLSDDAKARKFAENLGLEVHGSIGLLLWAAANRYVTSKKKNFDVT